MASELCRRGVYTRITLGNHKETDLLVETDTWVARISVKTKQANMNIRPGKVSGSKDAWEKIVGHVPANGSG